MVAGPVALFLIPLHVVGLACVTVKVLYIESVFRGRCFHLPLVVDSAKRHAGVLGTHTDLLAVVGEGVEVAFLAYRPDDGSILGRNLIVNRGHCNAGVIVAGAIVSAQCDILRGADDDDLVAHFQGVSPHVGVTGDRGGFGRLTGLGGSFLFRALDKELEAEVIG